MLVVSWVPGTRALVVGWDFCECVGFVLDCRSVMSGCFCFRVQEYCFVLKASFFFVRCFVCTLSDSLVIDCGASPRTSAACFPFPPFNLSYFHG